MKTKTTLTFISLKILEIGGVIALFRFSAWYWGLLEPDQPVWYNGFMGIVVPVLLVSVSVGIYLGVLVPFIKLNIKWAKNITKEK